MGLKTAPLGFDWKKIFAVGSLLSSLGIAGIGIAAVFGVATGPAGLILTGGFIGFKLIGKLFRDQTEKRREAIHKLYTSLTQEIENQEKKMLAELEKNFPAYHQKLFQEIEKHLTLLIDALTILVQKIDTAVDQASHDIETLERMFAWRILNAACDAQAAPIPFDDARIASDITNIVRDIGASFSITSSRHVPPDREKRLSEIVQEQVKFLPAQQ